MISKVANKEFDQQDEEIRDCFVLARDAKMVGLLWNVNFNDAWERNFFLEYGNGRCHFEELGSWNMLNGSRDFIELSFTWSGCFTFDPLIT